MLRETVILLAEVLGGEQWWCVRVGCSGLADGVPGVRGGGWEILSPLFEGKEIRCQ